MTRRILIALLILLFSVVAVAAANRIVFLQLGLHIVQERVGLVPLRDEDRPARLQQLFTNAGCPQDHQQLQTTDSELPNVICTIRGSGPNAIVIGAHYDHHGGSGALDNWSGAAMLPILAESIGSVAMRHTLIFVAFGGKYHGASGSRVFMRNLTDDQKQHITAMINLDSLGLTMPRYWPDNGLVQPLQIAALNEHLPQLRAWQVDHEGLADTDVFRKAKIPSITIHSLGREGTDLLYVVHSREDTVKALDMRAYYETYQILSVFLAYLDQIDGSIRLGPSDIPMHDRMRQPGSHQHR
ncbi:MAG TPA: M28 family peptidase [Terriglobales bacterium]|nr:M28 family peptidase [Terriglobales bacterium]